MVCRNSYSNGAKGIPVEMPMPLSYIVLFLTTLLWHGVLLTNDGTIWDSWYVLNWLQNKNWAALHEFFDSVGMPIYGWLYRPFAFAPEIVFAFMVATFLCLFAQSVLTYALGEESRRHEFQRGSLSGIDCSGNAGFHGRAGFYYVFFRVHARSVLAGRTAGLPCHFL